ncbi:MAG: M48 family metallopeptidase, partial [Bdellovibrionota bacterium]
MRIFSPGNNSLVKNAFTQSAELLQKLSNASDGNGPIHFLIIDDMSPNAFFTKLPNGERTIGINLGLLKSLQTDDELAFVLGHELEHGPSELQAEITRLRERGQFNFRLQAPVENEVDAKSAVKRVHEAGYNPYAGLKVLSRFEDEFGDLGTVTHTASSSRRDTLGLILAAAKRMFGKRFKPDEPGYYKNEILQPVQDRFLKTPKFAQVQEARMREVAQRPVPAFRQAFEELKTDNPVGSTQVYEEVFQERWSEISKLLPDPMDKRAIIDFQIGLHSELNRQFLHAENEVLGAHFKPQNAQVLQQWMALQDR